ncbi:MAG: sodium:proton antiporter [Planctomycetota bacterium]
MHDAHSAPTVDSTKRTLLGIAVALAAYAAATAAGWPQHGRDLIVEAQAAHGPAAHASTEHAATEHATTEQTHGSGHAGTAPPPLTVLPFVLLLGAIAILPLTSRLSHWWEHNSSKLLVAGLLALITLVYYTLFHRQPVDLHFPTHATVAPAVGLRAVVPA